MVYHPMSHVGVDGERKILNQKTTIERNAIEVDKF